MAEGSTDIPGPKPQKPGRPCVQGGTARVVTEASTPAPPVPIRTHREGWEGKAGGEEPGKACRRFGLSKSVFRDKLHMLGRARRNATEKKLRHALAGVRAPT